MNKADWLTGVLGVCALAITGAAIVVTVQIGRVATLADDVRSTNSRIDTVFPALVSQANDVGSIKGSLEVSAQKIANVSDSLESMVPRLDAAVVAQETQAKNLTAMTEAVTDLTKAVTNNQNQLDAIASDVGKLKEIGFNPAGLSAQTYALAPAGFNAGLVKQLESSGVKVISVDGWGSWDDVTNAAAKSKLPPISNVWLSTTDPDAVNTIISATEKR